MRKTFCSAPCDQVRNPSATREGPSGGKRAPFITDTVIQKLWGAGTWSPYGTELLALISKTKTIAQSRSVFNNYQLRSCRTEITSGSPCATKVGLFQVSLSLSSGLWRRVAWQESVFGNLLLVSCGLRDGGDKLGGLVPNYTVLQPRRSLSLLREGSLLEYWHTNQKLAVHRSRHQRYRIGFLLDSRDVTRNPHFT